MLCRADDESFYKYQNKHYNIWRALSYHWLTHTVGNEERTQCAQSLNILASDSTKLRKVGRQLKPLFVYFFF